MRRGNVQAVEDPVAVVRELLAGDEHGHARATFMRGLTLGALIGAAIAGSLLMRRRAPHDPSPSHAEDHGR